MSTKVSESTGYGPNVQMSAFGYVMAAILVIITLPVLPVVALVWVLWRAFVSDGERESPFESWRNDPSRTRPRPPYEEEPEEDETEDEAEAEAEA